MSVVKRVLDRHLWPAYFEMRIEMDKSICKRRKVGAVLTLPDGLVVSRGHNSQTSGYKHNCLNIPRQCGCIHAEVAACARYYYDFITQMVPLTAVITCAPCITCYHAMRLVNVRTFWWVEDSEPGLEAIEAMSQDRSVSYQRFEWVEEEHQKESSKTLSSVS